MSCRLLVADSHWLIRIGLRAALSQIEGFEIVEEAFDTRQAVALTLACAPDIVLVEVDLPGEGGIAAVRQIKEQRRGQKALLLGDGGDIAPVREALRAGCDGFVRKNLSEHELLKALACVQKGGVYLDAELTREMVLSDYRRERPQVAADPLSRLTQREQVVFRLIGAGHTNRSAGDQMHLSAKTVEKYRATVMRKLGLRNAVELQLMARDLGAVAPPATLND